MGCLQLHNYTTLQIAHTSNPARSREGKSDAGLYKYKYQGQERQDELGLNWDSFKWRNYDYAIGRFMSIDPLTEKYEDYTPYQFASNQPVHAKELEGLENSHDLNKKIQTRETRTIVSDATSTNNRKKEVAKVVRSVSAEGAYTGIKSSVVRNEYKATVSKLDKADTKGRTEAKVNAREKTPAVVKAMLESERPMSVEMEKVSGTANKTNVGANATAEAFGAAGKGLAVLGIAASTYNIATSDNKVEATAVEGGAWAGAVAGGEMLGTASSAGGPYAAAAGALVGSIVGGFVGEKAVKGIVNELNQPHPDNLDKMTTICFVEGTKITMSDYSLKNIEEVKKGDLIQIFNTETNTVEIKEVLLPEVSKSDYFVEIRFENGTINTNTLSHPYYIVDKGWCSFDSKEAIKKYNVKVSDLIEGDFVYKLNENGIIENVQIISIKVVKMSKKTFNLSKVKDNHNFFANGILVHNRS